MFQLLRKKRELLEIKKGTAKVPFLKNDYL